MKSVHIELRNLIRGQFPAVTSSKSTAQFYSRYRVSYREELLKQLKADSNLAPNSLVLDLASVPGRLGLALAPSVREIVAVDVELEMIVEGKRLARRHNLGNVTWIHSMAEDLKVMRGSLDLVTIGERSTDSAKTRYFSLLVSG